MFNLVQQIDSKDKDSTRNKPEFDEYLSVPLQNHTANPLEFWEQNEKRLPRMVILAKKYLAIPATSASPERLFSTAGAIGRDRRARISTSLMEKTLTVREHYRSLNN
jgi:hypothetical protein